MVTADDDLFHFTDRLLLVIAEYLQRAEAAIADWLAKRQLQSVDDAVSSDRAAQHAARYRHLAELDLHLQRLMRILAGQPLAIEQRAESQRLVARYARWGVTWAECAWGEFGTEGY